MVGFTAPNPPKVYPADFDRLTPSQRRSYVSGDGATFTLFDSNPANAGNLGIRAVVTLGSGGGAGGGGDTTTGLVSRWKFDEGGGQTVRDSAGANNGTIQGTATWTAGKFGGALSLDGSANFVVGTSSGTAFPVGSAARTISSWVNVSSPLSYDNGVMHYGTIGGGTPSNFHLYLFANSGKVGFGNGYGYGTISGTTSVADGNWHNIVGVYEGSATNLARIYVDGVQQFSGMLSTVPNTLNGTPWRIGAFLGTSQGFRGQMDDVRLYNRALSAADVQTLVAGQ